MGDMNYTSIYQFPSVLSSKFLLTRRGRSTGYLIQKVIEWNDKVHVRVSVARCKDATKFPDGQFVAVATEDPEMEVLCSIGFSTDEDVSAIFSAIKDELEEIREADNCFRCGGTGKLEDYSRKRDCPGCSGTGDNSQKGKRPMTN